MKKILNRPKQSILLILTFLIISAGSAFCQDPTKVDSKHYKVVFENDQVRVIRITYGPGEKSVMHYHPDALAILMTDNKVKMTFKNGKSIQEMGKKGEISWTPAGYHLPENTGKEFMEVLLVEMKPKPEGK